jgi:hypothetical protein
VSKEYIKMTNSTRHAAFSLGENFYDSETGEMLENYEGAFYFKGQLNTVMYTWLENGVRHCAMNPKSQKSHQTIVNTLELPARILAADYKASGIDKQSSYGYFVKDRNLKPELTAKEFFKIYDAVSPTKLKRHILLLALGDAELTHTVEQNNQPARKIKLLEKNQHYIRFVFENGSSGTTPLSQVQSLTEL